MHWPCWPRPLPSGAFHREAVHGRPIARHQDTRRSAQFLVFSSFRLFVFSSPLPLPPFRPRFTLSLAASPRYVTRRKRRQNRCAVATKPVPPPPLPLLQLASCPPQQPIAPAVPAALWPEAASASATERSFSALRPASSPHRHAQCMHPARRHWALLPSSPSPLRQPRRPAVCTPRSGCFSCWAGDGGRPLLVHYPSPGGRTVKRPIDERCSIIRQSHAWKPKRCAGSNRCWGCCPCCFSVCLSALNKYQCLFVTCRCLRLVRILPDKNLAIIQQPLRRSHKWGTICDGKQ